MGRTAQVGLQTQHWACRRQSRCVGVSGSAGYSSQPLKAADMVMGPALLPGVTWSAGLCRWNTVVTEMGLSASPGWKLIAGGHPWAGRKLVAAKGAQWLT